MAIPEFGEVWLALLVTLIVGGWNQSRLSNYKHFALLGIVFVASQIPVFTGLSLAQILRGVISEPSITTMLLLTFWNVRIFARFQQLQDQKRLLLSVIAIFALPFYWGSLGGAVIDPYSWGYENWYLFGILIIGSILSGYRGYYIFPIIVFTALLADMVQLLESTNLWDYLFDPMLATYAIIGTFKPLHAKTIQQWKRFRTQ